MEKSKKILLVVAIFMLIALGLFASNSYAAPESNNSTNNSVVNSSNYTSTTTNTIKSNTTSTTNKNESNSKTSTTSTNKKSSNTNLSNLGIKPNDFSGFKASVISYNVTVPESVEEISVYATAQDSKATVSGTGKKKLETGKNTVTVTVTAEDGTEKAYTINITRGKTEENEEDSIENIESRGLSELKIAGLTLSPEFETNVYEYTAKYIGEDTKLDITTVATDEDYIVEVTGNEDLKEGENIITILVSDEDGNNVATYQVIINKSLVDEEALQREQAEKERKNKIIIGSVVAAVVILAIIIVLIVRHRRNKYYDDEDWETEEDHNDLFADENPKKQDVNNYEENENNEDVEFTEVKGEIEEEQIDDKEILRQKFLDNYNSNNYDDYEDLEEEKPRRKRKGKRFK